MLAMAFLGVVITENMFFLCALMRFQCALLIKLKKIKNLLFLKLAELNVEEVQAHLAQAEKVEVTRRPIWA